MTMPTVVYMITADPEGARYKRLAALLRARINSGELAVDQRLPSEKDLQDEYGMARETIRKAVGLLRSEGLVEVRQGHGTFVRQRGEQQVIKLAKGERATGPDAHAGGARRAGTRRGRTDARGDLARRRGEALPGRHDRHQLLTVHNHPRHPQIAALTTRRGGPRA